MIEIVKAGARHLSDFGWLKTYWLFSFSDYFDPRILHSLLSRELHLRRDLEEFMQTLPASENRWKTSMKDITEACCATRPAICAIAARVASSPWAALLPAMDSSWRRASGLLQVMCSDSRS